MSVREFAAYLGVSDRTVSKWEAGGARIEPRPDTQAMLDTVLAKASVDVRQRFHLLIGMDLPDLAPAATELPPPKPSAGPTQSEQTEIRHPITGKQMVLIPGGQFHFGPDRDVVDLAEFYIDITPVTNAAYSKFVAATGYKPPRHWQGGQFSTEIRRHPVVNVSFRDTQAYCRWAGTSLPTEAQWEKAATGTTGQAYPWGDQPTPAKCNVRESGIGRTTPVERYHSGVSPYGVYDLSGNVWEWCETETEPGRRVLKGSAFTSPFRMAAAAATNDASIDMLDDDTGFRCVVSGRPPS